MAVLYGYFFSSLLFLDLSFPLLWNMNAVLFDTTDLEIFVVKKNVYCKELAI